MGRISYIIAEVAKEKGVLIEKGKKVINIKPGESVELEDGEIIYSPLIISNADPKITLNLLGNNIDSTWKNKLSSISMESKTLKVNVVMNSLPNFKTRPGIFQEHHKGQINTTLTKKEWIEAYNEAKKWKYCKKNMDRIIFTNCT